MDGASEFSGKDPLNSLLEPEGSNAHLGLYLLGFLMVVGGVILFFMGLYLLGLAGLRGIGILALVVMVLGVFDVVLGVGVFRHRLWAVRVSLALTVLGFLGSLLSLDIIQIIFDAAFGFYLYSIPREDLD